MTSYKQNIGKKGEQIAANYLNKNGLQVLESNYYTRYGEIDLIAKENAEIVFVEVKTRSSKKHGEPQEAVTKSKQRNLIRTAQAYLQKHKLENADWRIDVITVMLVAENDVKIDYIKNAVTYF